MCLLNKNIKKKYLQLFNTIRMCLHGKWSHKCETDSSMIIISADEYREKKNHEKKNGGK